MILRMGLSRSQLKINKLLVVYLCEFLLILSRSSQHLFIWSLYPASRMPTTLWLTGIALIFGGFLLFRWLHPVLGLFSLLGMVLVVLTKVEVCRIQSTAISLGTGLWWQWRHYPRQAFQGVDLEVWMLEDTDPSERDVLYRVVLQTSEGEKVPVFQRWQEDRQQQEELAQLLREYIGHG